MTDMHASTAVDIFADRATPAARQARPALFRARMAWASSSRPNHSPALHMVGGVRIGDRIEVETSPGVRQAGTVVAWEKAGETGSAVMHGYTVARVRLDPVPDAQFAVVRRPRFRLYPITSSPKG